MGTSNKTGGGDGGDGGGEGGDREGEGKWYMGRIDLSPGDR